MSTYNPGKKFRSSSPWSEHRKHPTKGVIRPHRGQDWAAPAGTDIPAAADGTVIQKGWLNGYGNTIVIEHEIDGKIVHTLYGHMKEPSPLKIGTLVKKNQIVGHVGSTGGESSGNHLHFEVMEGRKRGDGIIKKGHKTTNPENFSFPEEKSTQDNNSSPKTVDNTNQIVNSITDTIKEIGGKAIDYFKEDKKSTSQPPSTASMPFLGSIEKPHEKKLSHFKNAAAQTTYGAMLWQAEGGGAIGKVNSNGYSGKYQMGGSEISATGRKLGYIDKKGNWTGKNGINSKADWLKSNQAQDEFFIEYTKSNWNALQNSMKKSNINLDSLIGKKVAGITITESGLLAASHLAGAGSVAEFIKTNGDKIAVDGSGKKMTDYLSMGANKDVSSITGNKFVAYKDIGALDNKEHKYHVAGMAGLSYTRKKDNKKITVKIKESEDYQEQQNYALSKINSSKEDQGSRDKKESTHTNTNWIEKVGEYFSEITEKPKEISKDSKNRKAKKITPTLPQEKHPEENISSGQYPKEEKKHEVKKEDVKKNATAVAKKSPEQKKPLPDKKQVQTISSNGSSTPAKTKPSEKITATPARPTPAQKPQTPAKPAQPAGPGNLDAQLAQLAALLGQLNAALAPLAKPIQITVDVQNGNIVAAVNAANSQQQRRN
ncbi:M23 family metallopeptidase [Chromobacterium violaceum]|uniref:M23 family metallopeptidase n=1 Tax=Chromobacterium violaceum TaxID=536 RepID=UPI0009B81298|nr:M23 family metallopeptidase [Chromobacterium violaceum]